MLSPLGSIQLQTVDLEYFMFINTPVVFYTSTYSCTSLQCFLLEAMTCPSHLHFPTSTAFRCQMWSPFISDFHNDVSISSWGMLGKKQKQSIFIKGQPNSILARSYRFSLFYRTLWKRGLVLLFNFVLFVGTNGST